MSHPGSLSRSRHRRSVRGTGLDHELVLDLHRCRQVRGICRIDEHARRNQHVRGVEVGLADLMPPGPMEDTIDVVVLVDDHDREVALAGVRDRHDSALGDVHHGDAVQRVAVRSDDRLVVDRDGDAIVIPAVDPAGVVLKRGEHPSVSARAKLSSVTGMDMWVASGWIHLSSPIPQARRDANDNVWLRRGPGCRLAAALRCPVHADAYPRRETEGVPR